jgi:hypothetical protein
MSKRHFAALEGWGPWLGKIYFFDGPNYYRYTLDGDYSSHMDPGYPAPLSMWSLPADFLSGIDAALLGRGIHEGKAYFFKGDQYARYDWKKDADGQDPIDFVKPLAGWNLPNAFNTGIDAALNGAFGFDGKAYFFKGNQYVGYHWPKSDSDPEGDAVDDPDFITSWNLPSDFSRGVDAAVNSPANYFPEGSGAPGNQYYRKAWFFKGRHYVRYSWKSNMPDLRLTLLAWGFQKERKTIVDKAREMMQGGQIHALARGPDGFRTGWEKLQKIFELAFPDLLQGDGLERRVKKSIGISNTSDDIPDWCGIYDLWATKAAGLNVGTWVPDKGLNLVTGFHSLHWPHFNRLDVGDVVVRPKEFKSHHAIITNISSAHTIDIISGNWAKSRAELESTVGEQQGRSISDYSAGWFSAFPS